MHYKKRNRVLVLSVFMIMTTFLANGQQESGMNVFSPYTMYGFGQMNTLGTAENKAMSGAGLASKSPIQLNGLNPAGLSAAPQKTFLFNFGIQGNNNYLKSGVGTSASNKFNISELGFQFPIAKNLGFGFLMNPYSSVGYEVNESSTFPDMSSDIGDISHRHIGSGGMSLIKSGFGYEIPFKGNSKLSIGANMLFYHQSIDRSSLTQITSIVSPSTSYRSIESMKSEYSTQANYELGLIYSLTLNKEKHQKLNIAATFQPKVTFDIEEIGKVSSIGTSSSTVVSSSNIITNMVMPDKYSVGATYSTKSTELSLDYIYQDFTGAYEVSKDNKSIGLGAYQDIRMGISYTPNRADIRNVFNRWAYRGGLRYSTSYLTVNNNKIKDFSLSLGLGIPLDQNGTTHMNVGIDLGQRGSVSTTSMSEKYFNVHVGVNLLVIREWFIRHKFK